MKNKHAFTLIELLVVIAIIAVLSVVVILSLNPAELLRQARDSGRISDMDTIQKALALTQVDGLSLGTANTVYVSLPDPSATSTAGDQCQGLGLPSLPATYAYHCAASSTYRNINGTGWVPVNLTASAQGSSLSELPQDPISSTSSRLYYTYVTNGSQYETTAVMESSKYKPGGARDVISTDGGPLASVYEKGTKLGLEPLDYGDNSLVGYWTFDEGSGGTAYDYSGSNATGSWNGTGVHYVAGKIGSYAGQFATSTGDYINLGNIASVQGISGITITAWINPTALSGEECVISKYGGAWLFEPVNSGLSFYVGTSNGMKSTSGGTLTTGSWQFITGIYDGQNIRTLINGVQVASSPQTGNISISGTSVQIGSYSSGAYIFPGLIDDVRIYNRALSAAEIQAMYSGNK